VQFLADESFDFGAVCALREAGHDVVAIVELDPGIPDPEVARLALEDGRILLTEDKDFGQLVHAAGTTAHGVLFVRFPAKMRQGMIRSVEAIVERLGTKLRGHFVVLQPGQARISELPRPSG
jgi:predicted nuclease of predicted toxin-antitoxin system